MCCSSGDLVRQIRLGARLSVVGASVGVMSVRVCVGRTMGVGSAPATMKTLTVHPPIPAASLSECLHGEGPALHMEVNQSGTLPCLRDVTLLLLLRFLYFCLFVCFCFFLFFCFFVFLFFFF